MRVSTGNLRLESLVLLLLVTFTAAWPVWPRWLPELDALIVRQNTETTTQATKTTASTTPKETGSNTDSTTDSNSDSTTSKSSQTTTGTGKNTNSGSSSVTKTSGGSSSTSGTQKATTTKKTTTTFDANLAAGGISMLSPPAASGAQYYKIGGDPITFAWNYTSLLSTPTAVNILATCTKNSQLYTLAANQSVSANSTGSVTWDTSAYQETNVQSPLLTETYTLIIYDAASSVSATAQAGYLAVFNTYTFGMYSPQPYTPLGEFKCVTCSGAGMERMALGVVMGVGGLTILGFSWFVGGTGVLW